MDLRCETDENANSKYNQKLLQSLPGNILSHNNIQVSTDNGNSSDDSKDESQDNDNVLKNYKNDLQNKHRSKLNEDNTSDSDKTQDSGNVLKYHKIDLQNKHRYENYNKGYKSVSDTERNLDQVNILKKYKNDIEQQNKDRPRRNEDCNLGSTSDTERNHDQCKEEQDFNDDNLSYNYVLELQPYDMDEHVAMVTTNVAKTSPEPRGKNKFLLVNGVEYAENRKTVNNALCIHDAVSQNYLNGETRAEKSYSEQFTDVSVRSDTNDINMNHEKEKESHIGIIDVRSIKKEPEPDNEVEQNFVDETFDEIEYTNTEIKQEPINSELEQEADTEVEQHVVDETVDEIEFKNNGMKQEADTEVETNDEQTCKHNHKKEEPEPDHNVTVHTEKNQTVTGDVVQDFDKLKYIINRNKLNSVEIEREESLDSEDQDMSDYIENNYNIDELRRIYGLQQKPSELEKVQNVADGFDKNLDKQNNGYNQIKKEPYDSENEHNVSSDSNKVIDYLKQMNTGKRKESEGLQIDQHVSCHADKGLTKLECRNIGIKQEPCEDVNTDNGKTTKTSKCEQNISRHLQYLDQDMNDGKEFLEDNKYLSDVNEDTNDGLNELVEDKDCLAELDEDFMDAIDDLVEDIEPKKKRKGRKQSDLTWEERLVCPICNKKFTHPCNRLAHEKMVHRKLKPRVCGVCGKGFYSSATLKKHMNSHTGNRPYKCTMCGKGFTQPGNMHRHMKSHALVASYKCPICQRAFKEQGNMKRHIETHSDVKKYACKICSKPFRTSSNLQRHIEMIHRKTRNYFCQICDKSFSCADSIRLHMKIHTNERNHVCPTCGKRFMIKSALKRHLAIHLREEEHVFQCGICDKGFKAMETLTGHMVCHTTGNSHICYICNQNFPNATKLKEHKLSHSDEKPFVCQTCNKAFSKVHTLRRHALIHGKLKPFSCELCDKSFLYSWYLKTHMNVHVGDRPYACKLCDKAFGYKPALKSHMRIHTGQRDHHCDVCKKYFSDSGSYKRHEKCRMHKRKVLQATVTYEQSDKTSSVKPVIKSKKINKTSNSKSLDIGKKKEPVAKKYVYISCP